jgi:FkbM family methyltransferase
MNAQRFCGKLVQLSNVPLSLWKEFLRGWWIRDRVGIVPCGLPKSERLIKVPLRDFYDSYSFFTECKRGRDELHFFLNRLLPGDVLYDIGAFRGVYGVATKAMLGNRVSVHLFEPVEHNLRCIEEIARLNQFQQFTIVGKAVATGECIKGVFHESNTMLGDDVNEHSLVEIPSVSLDSYVQDSKTHPSVMKIDVEGFELEVLQGAKNCLKDHRPRLWLELHPTLLRARGRSWNNALEIVRSAGYETISFYRDKELPTHDLAFHVWCAP